LYKEITIERITMNWGTYFSS